MLKYTNRIGDIYYLKESVTKTGKPRFFFSRKKEGKGKLVDILPEGREIYERPENGQVFLRKRQINHFFEKELNLIKSLLALKPMPSQYLYQGNKKYLTIYESSRASALSGDIMSHSLSPLKNAKELAAQWVGSGHFTAVLRFRLDDPDDREFTVERFCFLGGIDDWIFLETSGSLDSLARKWISLIGTDEFYNPFAKYQFN